MNSSLDQTRYGLRIVSFREPTNWKFLPVTDGIPFNVQAECPADRHPLSTVATLVEDDGAKQVRIGTCPACGYVGYQDRPTREWVDAFYRDTWSDAPQRCIPEEVLRWKDRAMGSGERDQRTRRTTELALRFGLTTDRPICEIGCGYGEALAWFRCQGFTNLIGMESSAHRALVARRAFEVNVLSGPFEDTEVQSQLASRAPFGLIFAHQVLEHVYDPDGFIRRVATLQSPGDLLILSLPNVKAEFSFSVLLYLPHLHSFSRRALTSLLARHGYAVVDDSSTTPWDLFVVARRHVGALQPVKGALRTPEAVAKLSAYLGLPRSYRSRHRLLWGSRRVDVGGQIPQLAWMGSSRMQAGYWWLASRWLSYRHREAIIARLGAERFELRHPMITAEVTDLERRFTRPEESPLEIQFDGPVLLSYK